MNDKTVLISGAGIAGPTLAFWLKAAGFEPALIERVLADINADHGDLTGFSAQHERAP
jgi:2-polyprenyl-6-methoxyphenol hydroxylase-like FAD-dependent oxidoreductase